MQLNSDSFCDSVQTWMEVIGHLWAELGFWLFSRKRVKMSAAADIWKGADILACFDKSCRYNKPCQYGRDAAHISWADLWADSTWGLQGDEATPSEERSSAGLRRRTEWRVCRAQIVRSLGAYLNCRPPTFQLLSYLMFYIMRRGHVWQGADISCRRTYFWT